MEQAVNDRSRHPSKCCLVQLLVIGIIQIILGVIIMGIGAAVVDKYGRYDKPINSNAAPIWSTFIFLTSGCLAICVFASSSNKALVIAHNILAILSTVFAVAVITSAASGINKYEFSCKYEFRICKEYGSILAFAILQFILAIWSCVVGFSIHNCCCYPEQTGNPRHQNTNLYQMYPQRNEYQMQSQLQPHSMPQQPCLMPQQPQFHQMTQQPQIHQMTVINGADGMQYALVPIQPITQAAVQIQH